MTPPAHTKWFGKYAATAEFQEPAATGYADMRGSLDAAAQATDLNNWRLEARVYMREVVSW